jgi:thiamine biosynthesis lipoprotein
MTAGYFDAWAGGHFDPSGVVKGWSIERASAMLAVAGWPDHAIDGGGDVRLCGDPGTGKPWQVGVRHPLHEGSYCAALSLDEGAVATSGTYERGLHVLDPRTGEPATQLASVTVIGRDLTTTDAYATAALAMGRRAPAWLSRLGGYEALVVDVNGGGWSTVGFQRHCARQAA